MTSSPDADEPNVVVIAGPNGAGKTTVAGRLLPQLGIVHFVNADDLARGLSAFDPESVTVTAGRLMLARIHELALRRESLIQMNHSNSWRFVTRVSRQRS